MWGFLETQNENCFELIRNFPRSNLDVDSNSMYITRGHRLEPRRQGVQVHKRPIIVNFRDYCDVGPYSQTRLKLHLHSNLPDKQL